MRSEKLEVKLIGGNGGNGFDADSSITFFNSMVIKQSANGGNAGSGGARGEFYGKFGDN